VPFGLVSVAANVSTILEIADVDVQSAVEDFHDARCWRPTRSPRSPVVCEARRR
jgi:hypothetical protein